MGKTWVYGDPNPKSWRETAEIMQARAEKEKVRKPRKAAGLYDRLVQLESLVKEKK